MFKLEARDSTGNWFYPRARYATHDAAANAARALLNDWAVEVHIVEVQ
jgi:hypothetical protein